MFFSESGVQVVFLLKSASAIIKYWCPDKKELAPPISSFHRSGTPYSSHNFIVTVVSVVMHFTAKERNRSQFIVVKSNQGWGVSCSKIVKHSLSQRNWQKRLLSSEVHVKGVTLTQVYGKGVVFFQ